MGKVIATSLTIRYQREDIRETSCRKIFWVAPRDYESYRWRGYEY